jgi:hypothetical protein
VVLPRGNRIPRHSDPFGDVAIQQLELPIRARGGRLDPA